MKKSKKIITKTSFELASALKLEHSDAIIWELRLSMAQRILKTAKQKRISVTDLAKTSKTSRARITKILKEETQGISLDVLVRVLVATGQKVKFNYKRVS